MRLKNIPGSREVIADSCFVIHDPEEYRGKWKNLFGNDYPLHIEIGMGKGKFIMGMAELHPDVNYVGIEKYSSVLLRAIQKMEEVELPNVKFIRMDAEDLTKVFGRGEAGRIYLNFSDPWPPNNRAKRRLTYRAFLAVYDKILRPGGQIHMKTDNARLFEFSLNEFSDFGMRLSEITFDLHSTKTENIMTEYEEKFSSQGMPIYRCVATKQA